MPSRQWISWGNITGYLGGHHEANVSLSQLVKIDDAISAVRLVGHFLFARPDDVDRLRQVAVPLHRIHAEVQVCIDDKHETKILFCDRGQYWAIASRRHP